MERVRVFLATPLLVVRGQEHLPAEAMCLDGVVQERIGGGLVVAVSAWADRAGRPLEASPATLYLPSGKIDHVLLVDEA